MANNKAVEMRHVLDHKKTGPGAAKLLTELQSRIVGQPDPLKIIVEAWQQYQAGLSNGSRPLGNFLFLGPTGTGKTRTVEALAESLYGNTGAMLKIDCGEFQHSHEVAKIIGSPPGYLGHRETQALLSQKNLDRHHNDKVKISLVLFDEIEKASDALWNMMLSIMDKGTLTMGDNSKVDFTKAFIFMTGNMGAKAMADSTHDGMGFGMPKSTRQENEIKDRLNKIGVDEARKRFTPEFYNRIDRVVVFNPLGMPELEAILGLELKAVQKRVFYTPNEGTSTTVPFVFSITQGARKIILKCGYDIKFGARHIKRAVEKQIVQPLANLIMNGEIRDGDLVDIDAAGDELIFVRVKEGLNLMAMAEHCSDLYLKDSNLPSTVDGGDSVAVPNCSVTNVVNYSDILGDRNPAPASRRRGTKAKKDLVVRRL